MSLSLAGRPDEPAVMAPWPNSLAALGQTCILMPEVLVGQETQEEATRDEHVAAKALVDRLRLDAIQFQQGGDLREALIGRLMPLLIEQLDLKDTAVVFYRARGERAELPGECLAAPQVLYVGDGNHPVAALKTPSMSYANAISERVSDTGPNRGNIEGFLLLMRCAVSTANRCGPRAWGSSVRSSKSLSDAFFNDWADMALRDPKKVLRLANGGAWQSWTPPSISRPLNHGKRIKEREASNKAPVSRHSARSFASDGKGSLLRSFRHKFRL